MLAIGPEGNDSLEWPVACMHNAASFEKTNKQNHIQTKLVSKAKPVSCKLTLSLDSISAIIVYDIKEFCIFQL
jgi:hypothetical protein